MSRTPQLTGTVTRDYQMPVGTIVTIEGTVVDDDDNPVDITGATIEVRWKSDPADLDADAVATAPGTVTDGLGGAYEFTVPAAATASADEALAYHVEVVNGADTYYPQKGSWRPYVR